MTWVSLIPRKSPCLRCSPPRGRITGVLPNFQRSLLEEGRQELKAQFPGEVQWEIHTRRRSLSIDRYVDLLNSYANAADARSSLALGVTTACGTLDGVEIDDHEYLCVAKKL